MNIFESKILIGTVIIKEKKIKAKKGKVHLVVQTSYLGVTVDDILDELENNN